MLVKFINKKNELLRKLKIHIRKKAIRQFEDKLELLQKKISDYSKDELESLVATEERKIRNSYRNRSVLVLLALIGINL